MEEAQEHGGGAYPTLEAAQPAQTEKEAEPAPEAARDRGEGDGSALVGAQPAQGKRVGRKEQGKSPPHGRPTLEEVRAYTVMRGSPVDADTYYEVRSRAGWRDKKGEPIRDWRADIRSWERYQRESPGSPASPAAPASPGKSGNSIVQASSFDAEEFFAAAVRRSYEDWPESG